MWYCIMSMIINLSLARIGSNNGLENEIMRNIGTGDPLGNAGILCLVTALNFGIPGITVIESA